MDSNLPHCTVCLKPTKALWKCKEHMTDEDLGMNDLSFSEMMQFFADAGATGLRERLKVAFWASLTNANAGMKWLDHDSMDEMIEAAWIGFEQPSAEAISSLLKALERAGERFKAIADFGDPNEISEDPEEYGGTDAVIGIDEKGPFKIEGKKNAFKIRQKPKDNFK